jgi:hypothetical protein
MQRDGDEDVAAGDALLLPTSAAVLPLEGKMMMLLESWIGSDTARSNNTRGGRGRLTLQRSTTKLTAVLSVTS